MGKQKGTSEVISKEAVEYAKQISGLNKQINDLNRASIKAGELNARATKKVVDLRESHRKELEALNRTLGNAYSFDDRKIGKLSDSGCSVATVEIHRPGPLPLTLWYHLAAEIIKVLNKGRL